MIAVQSEFEYKVRLGPAVRKREGCGEGWPYIILRRPYILRSILPLIPRASQGHKSREKQTRWVFEGVCIMDKFGSGNTLRFGNL